VSERKRVVLVVDDDDEIRQALRDLLTDEGYPVYCAGNGLVALALLKEIPRPCVILLDLMMPVMDGRAFLGALREDSARAAIPVTVITAANDTAGLAGVRVLRKPIDVEKLLEVVDDCARSSA
jgi:CheY-like chemotaxis protein